MRDGAPVVGQRLHDLQRAVARRIDEQLVHVAQALRAPAALGVEVVRDETRAIREAVRRARWPRRGARARPSPPCRSRRAPLAASGSVKLPSPQKRSPTRSPGCGSSMSHRALHQHAIDARVHLREFGGTEGKPQRRIRAARNRAPVPRADGTDARSPAPWVAATTGCRGGRRTRAAAAHPPRRSAPGCAAPAR